MKCACCATLCSLPVKTCSFSDPIASCPCFRCRCLQFKVVFDAVYTPRETRLLRDAVAAGCLVAEGVAMFVGQAVEQLKLFTGMWCWERGSLGAGERGSMELLWLTEWPCLWSS